MMMAWNSPCKSWFSPSISFCMASAGMGVSLVLWVWPGPTPRAAGRLLLEPPPGTVPAAVAEQPGHVRPRAGLVGAAGLPAAADVPLEQPESQAGVQPRAAAVPAEAVVQRRPGAAAQGRLLAATGALLPVAGRGVPTPLRHAAARTVHWPSSVCLADELGRKWPKPPAGPRGAGLQATPAGGSILRALTPQLPITQPETLDQSPSGYCNQG